MKTENNWTSNSRGHSSVPLVLPSEKRCSVFFILTNKKPAKLLFCLKCTSWFTLSSSPLKCQSKCICLHWFSWKVSERTVWMLRGCCLCRLRHPCFGPAALKAAECSNTGELCSCQSMANKKHNAVCQDNELSSLSECPGEGGITWLELRDWTNTQGWNKRNGWSPDGGKLFSSAVTSSPLARDIRSWFFCLKDSINLERRRREKTKVFSNAFIKNAFQWQDNKTWTGNASAQRCCDFLPGISFGKSSDMQSNDSQYTKRVLFFGERYLYFILLNRQNFERPHKTFWKQIFTAHCVNHNLRYRILERFTVTSHFS